MFKSISYKKFYGNAIVLEIEIVDTDFTETISFTEIINFGFVHADITERNIINTCAKAFYRIYSKRNLDIASNLSLCILFYHEKADISIQDIINLFCNNELASYKKEIEKILLFS